MKKIIVPLLVIAGAAVAYLIFRKDLNHSGKIETSTFAIPFNPDIDRIFYSSNDRNKGYLDFTRDDNGNWWVKNAKNKYPVDSGSVNDLLKHVLPRLEVHSPVNKSALDQVNRQMALSATKAQFYQGKKLIRTFYVGNRTVDDLGTYMYMPGTDKPCIVRIPGHNGYVTPFFSTDINQWRTLNLIDIPASEISEVKVNWPERESDGFIIRKSGDEVTLATISGRKVDANRNRLLAYLDMFTSIAREAGDVAGVNKTAEKDSILAGTAYVSIAITLRTGKLEQLNIYRMKTGRETYTPEDAEGNLKVYETESYWGSLAGSGEIWVVQDVVLRNRLKKLSDFTF